MVMFDATGAAAIVMGCIGRAWSAALAIAGSTGAAGGGAIMAAARCFASWMPAS